MHFHHFAYFPSKPLTSKHLNCARMSRANGRTILTLSPGVPVLSQWPHQPGFLSVCQSRTEFQVPLPRGSLANAQQRRLLRAPAHPPPHAPSRVTSTAPKPPRRCGVQLCTPRSEPVLVQPRVNPPPPPSRDLPVSSLPLSCLFCSGCQAHASPSASRLPGYSLPPSSFPGIGLTPRRAKKGFLQAGNASCLICGGLCLFCFDEKVGNVLVCVEQTLT